MINEGYYKDIKHFPLQFAQGLELAKNIKIEGNFNRVTLCGMGGSSFYTALINDILATDGSIKFSINAVKGYKLPANTGNDTLIIISSYSGNTEEPLTCLEEAHAKNLPCVVVTSGGQAEELAIKYQIPTFKIPGGIQPRLSTGFFIAGVFQIMTNCGLIPDMSSLVLAAAETITNSLDEKLAQDLAVKLVDSVPIIYSTDNISSLAYISKIKFNENTKIQAFWNYFPELNHNEMVGYTKLLMKPYFIIFKSQYTNKRNYRRMDVFKQILSKQNVNIFVLELKGKNILEEILMGYYFIDHVTYYLAEIYGIDPEPVALVEEFKGMLDE